jgi:hypothetical protein
MGRALVLMLMGWGAATPAVWGDAAQFQGPTWQRYELLAHKLRIGRELGAWRGLSGSWELEGAPFCPAGPALTGRLRAQQQLRLRPGVSGAVQVAAERDLAHAEWLQRRVEAQLRVAASPIRGLALKLEPHAWTDEDFRHLRAAVRSSAALGIWGPLSLAAELDSEYDQALGQWQHSPTVGVRVESKEFNWKLPRL